MLVADENNQNNSSDWIRNSKGEELREGNIEIIGKEKTALKIKKDGVLHFAVNDIVLTDDVIEKMYKEFIGFIMDKHQDDFKNVKRKDFMSKISQYINGTCDIDGLNKLNDYYGFSRYKDIKNDTTGLRLGYYPGREADYPLINELIYYKRYKFRNAWFVDNIGSFLIVIERKR